MAGKNPTLHEVAAQAGVSIATVSRVARGFGQVSPATRGKVLEVIENMNYRPSHFGRALVKRRHGALGLVFPGLRGPYYSEVIHGFELESVAARMSLMIVGTELLGSAEEQVLGMADRTDGLAVMGGAVGDELVQRLVRRQIPVVTLSRRQLDDIPNVRVDNYSNTVALTRHLIDVHGYRNLQFIGNIVGAPDATDRWAGFQQAHREAGLNPPDDPVAFGYEQTAGVLAANQIFDRPPWPEAIVCGNDELAFGALSAAAAREIRVPHDLAITGWDDIPFARIATPPLTTVHQPARDLGAETARMLLNRINGLPDPPEELVLPTRLEIRASCGCRPVDIPNNGAPLPAAATGSGKEDINETFGSETVRHPTT